jgi:hypothetical protein
MKTPALARAAYVLSQLRQVLHQAALAAGSIILVKNALFGSFVQSADCYANGFHRAFLLSTIDCNQGFRHHGAGFATKHAVSDALLLILPVPFYLRLNISQFFPPTIQLPKRRRILTDASVFVHSEFIALPGYCLIPG